MPRRSNMKRPTLGGMAKKAGAKVMKSYIKGTESMGKTIAKKIAPYADKLPKMPSRRRRMK